jgi:mycothiol synthase
MQLRRVDTGPELAELESRAFDWSESPHQPSLSEETRLQLRSARGMAFVSDGPEGIATLTSTKRPEIGMVEVAVPGHVSAADFWDGADAAVREEAAKTGLQALELLTWDPGLRGEMEDRGWQRERVVNRGTRTSDSLPSLGSPAVKVFDRERDAEELLEVNNRAFIEHPEAGDWDRAGLDKLFGEPWFDPSGLLVTRDGPTVTGFCWTKVHPDAVGEIYLLAVRPEWTRRGLGRALVIAGLKYLADGRGCEQVLIYWDGANSAASNLYQSIGFRVDRVAGVFRHRL